MSGDGTDQTPVPDADAAGPGDPPAEAIGVPPFVIPDAEAVEVPPFEIPAAEAVEVPPFEIPDAVLTPDPVIPEDPAPVADASVGVAPALDEPDAGAPAEPPVAETATPPAAGSHEFPTLSGSTDAAAASAPETVAAFSSEPATGLMPETFASVEQNADAFTQPPSGSYRGWTIAIFGGLGALLVAAIIAVVYLATSVPLNWPSSDPEPDEPVTVTETTPAEAPPAAPEEPDAVEEETGQQTIPEPSGTGQCSDFCAEISALITDRVTGQDGTSWVQSRDWESAEQSGLDDIETVTGEYYSSAGFVTFTVWTFADDAAADEAFAALAAVRGEPSESGSVYESGAGVRNSYEDADSSSILWSVTGDESQPWVMLVDGPDDPAVLQFYLSLPI